MSSFQTQRLFCRSLTLEEYAEFEAGREPTWADLSNPYSHFVEGPNPLRHRIPRVNANPEFAEIGLVLAIEKTTRELIGSAGFHDFPDDNGMIEIGFGIVPEKQNQGYGRELLHGMWHMISARSDVKILRYTVSPTNAPSMHIIHTLRFDLVGEQMDDVDGLELIYEMPIDKYLAQFHEEWKTC